MYVHCSYVLANGVCRDLRFSSFMSEFKNGKDRAKELLSNLPHIIPHRQVHVYVRTFVLCVYQ